MGNGTEREEKKGDRCREKELKRRRDRDVTGLHKQQVTDPGVSAGPSAIELKCHSLLGLRLEKFPCVSNMC